MLRIFFIVLIFLPSLLQAQPYDMRVYTVAGSLTATALGNGGPATAASLSATEGIWMDNNCNLYISELGSRIRKVNTMTGIISPFAGTGIGGYSGDGGLAINAKIETPYGLYSDGPGNVYFSDYSTSTIRRVDAVTGIITHFAGLGLSLGDGGPASAAKLDKPNNVYGDAAGNFYISELGRIRKVNTSGIITTIAGIGGGGMSGDGGPATLAKISGAASIVVDGIGNLYFTDRNNGRVRKINKATGIITTVAGTVGGYYTGDGGQATNAGLTGPIGLAIDQHENLIIADNGNDYIRRVDAKTGIITTIAGVGYVSIGSTAEGAPATNAQMHPEFLYLDLHGSIYYSNYGTQIRKINYYTPGLPVSGSRCGPPAAVQEVRTCSDVVLYPNPTQNELTINAPAIINAVTISNTIGQVVYRKEYHTDNVQVDVGQLPVGVYTVKITGEGWQVVKKVEKE